MDRARKVQRMLAVQQQLTRIEEWKLADLERTLEHLEATQTELIGALNDHDALQGLFLDALARRLRATSDAAARVGQEKEAQSATLLEHAVRKACAERLAETVALQAGRRRIRLTAAWR